MDAVLLRWMLPGALAAGLLVAAGCDGDAVPADPGVSSGGAMLLVNARLYTFDPGDTVVEDGALAFSTDGEILALGDSEAMQRAFPEAERIDLQGRTVLPGLIDAHAHLYGLAVALTRADLVGAGSKQEVLERLRAFEAGLGPDDWLLGRGWDQNDWPETVFPTRGDLDGLFPDRPVWLERIDGHAGWGNSAALAAVDRELGGTWQPQGGFIHRDPAGAPTGILVDGAMALVESAVPPPSPTQLAAALDRATEMLAAHGVTGVHDAGASRAVLDLYRARIEAGAFPLRVYAMADGAGETMDWLCAEGHYAHASGRLEMRAVKLFADGALGSRGAALLDDYADDPGNRGLLFSPDADLEAQATRAARCGLQVAVHAIGDRANRQALDVFERLLAEVPDNPGRHRVEHAQLLAPADLPRFGRLGVIASVQPTHATSDMYWAGERLGEERLAGAYAWRSLADSGAALAFGSDFPVEDINPLLGIYAAVSRQDLDGWPEHGWQPHERLDRIAAVRGFTGGAAFAAFMEDRVGSLEPGKRADFVVFDRDPMTVPAAEIPELRVIQTWLDGQRVYPAVP